MVKRPSHPVHDQTIDALAERLSAEHRFDSIEKNFEYCRGRLNGEVDVLARAGDQWYFFEVKVSHRENTYKKAKEQFKRFCQAYPDRDIIGVYVTPKLSRYLPSYGGAQRPGIADIVLQYT